MEETAVKLSKLTLKNLIKEELESFLSEEVTKKDLAKTKKDLKQDVENAVKDLEHK